MSGATYYLYEPELDSRPFERLIVGLTPTGRQVFSIRLEMHGDKDKLNTVIEQTRKTIGEHHVSVTWEVIGNHHYGSGNRTYRKMVIDERHNRAGNERDGSRWLHRGKGRRGEPGNAPERQD